jgi:Brp/Blh family beta-carotene 15,15'-monooxygenase
MTKTNFIFISLFLLLLPAFPLVTQLSSFNQNLFALSIILILGIPHGAIDNVIYLEKSRISPVKFYLFYLTTIFINAALWFFFPLLSISIFIIISSYHFGQSQFARIFKRKGLISNVTFFLWGFSVIMGFIYFNLAELTILIETEIMFREFTFFFTHDIIYYVLLTSTILTLTLFAVLFLKGRLKAESLIIETLVLALIYLTAYLFTFLTGFALFFIALHSFKMLQEEFNYLYRSANWSSVTRFIHKLLPLTLISILGVMVILSLIYFDLLNITYAFALLIIISSITLPHVYVMEKFYHH